MYMETARPKKVIDANFYSRVKNKYKHLPEKVLSEKEWKELIDLLESNMRSTQIYEHMSRGRGRNFIKNCVELMGIDVNARQAEITRKEAYQKNLDIYLVRKKEIDRKIHDFHGIENIRKEFNLSRSFTVALVEKLGYDYNDWVYQGRCKFNKTKSWEKKTEPAIKYSKGQILALASAWTSKVTPNQFYYWHYPTK